MKLVDRIFLALCRGIGYGCSLLFAVVAAIGIAEGAPAVVYVIFVSASLMGIGLPILAGMVVRSYGAALTAFRGP